MAKKKIADKPAEAPVVSAEVKALEGNLEKAKAEESRLMEELAAAHKARADAEQALADAQEE